MALSRINSYAASATIAELPSTNSEGRLSTRAQREYTVADITREASRAFFHTKNACVAAYHLLALAISRISPTAKIALGIVGLVFLGGLSCAVFTLTMMHAIPLVPGLIAYFACLALAVASEIYLLGC